MSTLNLSLSDIPDCTGKTAVITGGSSGIGWEASRIFSSRGADVFLLDVSPPQAELPMNVNYVACDITNWGSVLAAFQQTGDKVDILIANAGVSEETDYFQDTFDANGQLEEPAYNVINVNLRGTLNTIKVALSIMRRRGVGGRIVITSSATAYSPEHSLPVYSAVKLGLVGLMRALRSSLPLDNITINTVAPAATLTGLLPPNLAAPIMALGLPTSSAEFVGLAVVYSATAQEPRQVELYGKDDDTNIDETSRRGGVAEDTMKGKPWNGRAILTLGDQYTELEQGLSDLRPSWFGPRNSRLTRMQQKATDFRPAAV